MTCLSSHFHLHPCLYPQDLSKGAQGYPISYIHHFFDESQRWDWPDQPFKVNIFFIPTNFATYVECEGWPSNSPLPSQVIERLQTAQPFPGGFVTSRAAFLQELEAVATALPPLPEGPNSKKAKLETANTKTPGGTTAAKPVIIPGRVVAEGDVAFADGRGEDKFWLLEFSLPIPEEDRRASWFEFSTAQMAENHFGMIHRRIEWFMHFYIDAMSSIDLDSRWRCFVAVRYFQTPSLLSSCQKEEAAKRHQLPLAERRSQLEDTIRKNWPNASEAIMEEYAAALDGKASDDVVHVSNHFDAAVQKPASPFEILGLFTVYQFFALPKDRARVSQFFIFPHRQHVGLGRSVLAALTDLLAADSNIRQLSVEDPAPAFQRLRDVVSIDRAIHQGLLCPACLFPEEEIERAELRIPYSKSPVNPDNWPRYSEVFRRILLETPQQRRRLRLLLTLSRLIPSRVIGANETRLPDAQTDSRRRRKRERGDVTQVSGPRKEVDENALESWEKSTAAVTPLRVKEKRRLRLESMEWYSQQRSLGDVQHELEVEWQLLLKSVCGSIRVARRNHSLM